MAQSSCCPEMARPGADACQVSSTRPLHAKIARLTGSSLVASESGTFITQRRKLEDQAGDSQPFGHKLVTKLRVELDTAVPACLLSRSSSLLSSCDHVLLMLP